jgi:ribosomal protein L25 (general stress protein Ctc)
MPVSLPQQLVTMAQALLSTVKTKQSRVPALISYGYGVNVERVAFDVGRAALAIDYAIVPDEPYTDINVHSLDELQKVKEQRRLQHGVEVLLPSPDGWDIRIATRGSNELVTKLPWTSSASKWGEGRVRLHIQNSAPPNDHSVLKVKLLVEFSGALKGLQLNGLPQPLEEHMEHELRSFARAPQLLQDASSAAHVSLDSANVSVMTGESDMTTGSTSSKQPPLQRTESGVSVVPRGPAFDKTILSRVRRNYIYFSSLLQEPEAKWKGNSDVRGVSVTQLDSIDPTLVVYKAEATFVGVGLWDLYSAIVTPGARSHWDKQYDDSTLLEDVNELTELWHFKTKPAWPVTGRDAVILKTVYKAPTTIHVFSFSVDDAHLFPNIPAVDPTTIRTQIDLQGWAIDALSPTTTQVTLLEQSDPKGWTGKATIPQQMIASVAGVGEFAIKCGGPPVVTRLSGARATNQRYEHERGIFRVEYEPYRSRLPSPLPTRLTTHSRQNSIDSNQIPIVDESRSRSLSSTSIECELRCNADTWATSLDIVVDPPPQSISCLRRHRLSEGGGLWLTLGHDISMNSDERLQAIVRRAPSIGGKDKGVVMVNGKRINVDVEELPESEMKSLTKQKRVKPTRIPLDQPPVMGVIRKRRTDMGEGDDANDSGSESGSRKGPVSPTSPSSSAPKAPSPLSNFFTAAMEQMTSTTQQAVAAFVPPTGPVPPAAFVKGKAPVHYALDALAFAQAYHHGSYRENWVTVADKDFPIQKKTISEMSPIIPVHRGEKVIEGVTAEDVAAVISNYDYRKRWDDRFDSVVLLEQYGSGCHTSFLVSKPGFPFRDRGMFLASLIAKEEKAAITDASNSTVTLQSPAGGPGAIYCVSASFDPDSASRFDAARYNPYGLPIGRLHLDAWIIQTLDPYTTENYAIPSTRCTRLAAVDFAGSVPVAFNSLVNASLPRSIIALDNLMKSVSPQPEVRVPASFLQVLARRSYDLGGTWKLQNNALGTTFLQATFNTAEQKIDVDVIVQFELQTPDSSLQSSDDNMSTSPTRPSSRACKSGLSSRPSSPEPSRRSQRSTAASPSPPRSHHRKASSTSAATSPNRPLPVRSPSRERTMRGSSSTFSIGTNNKHQGPKDFVVAELVIDLKKYTEGYEIEIGSVIENRGVHEKPLNTTEYPALKWASDKGSLPVSAAAYLLSASPLYTPGSGDTPARHLLRLTLPTSQYEFPTVVDPLTGETRSAPPKPQWLKDLSGREKQAHIRVQVKQLLAEHQKKGKKVVLVNGSVVNVGSERDAGRDYLTRQSNSITLSRSASLLRFIS